MIASLPGHRHRTLVAAWIAAGALAVFAAPALAQTTYTWNVAGSGSWATSGNWSPARSSPNNSDILVINGTTTPAPTITNVPTQTIGRLRIINNAQVTFTAQSSAQTVTISGATAPQFEMTAGTSATFTSNRAITLNLTGSATGSIAGAITFNQSAHRLQAATANAVTFQSGGSLTTTGTFSGNAFGNSGTANVIVFASGSSYVHNVGSTPFGLAAPSSRVVFQSGSTAIWRTTAGFEGSGRTYGNLTVQNNTALTGSGTGNFAFGTLTLESGSSFTYTGSSSAAIAISGSLTSAGAGNLAITPGTGGITFNSGTVQTVGGGGGTGTITFGGNASVGATTTLALARTLTFSAGVLTVNGTLRRDAGGAISNAPTYVTGATLAYGGTATVGIEWGTGTAVGSGVPSHVSIAAGAGNTVTMPATDRTVPGNLTLTSGTLAMGAGNLNLGGNWTNSGGTFTANGRTVTLNGTANQTITSAGGETLFALRVDKTAGTALLGSALSLTGSSGDVLALVNAGGLDLNNQTLTLSGAGGNVLAGGTAAGNRSIGGTGTVLVTGAKTVTSANSKLLSFPSTVTVGVGAATNFGAGLTTIQGTLRMDAGGSVATNPPTYASGSTLSYAGGGARARGLEWSATSGAGYPHHVLVTSSTALDLAGGAPAVARQLAGNLTIAVGSSLSLDAMTASLTVLGNTDVSGTLTLSTQIGGDLRARGNLSVPGTWVANQRAVFFEGAATQTVTAPAALTLDYLRLAKSGGSVVLAADVVATGPGGGTSLLFDGTVDVLDLNGRQLTLGAAIGGTNANGAIRGSATSKLVLQGANAMGTLRFVSGFETLQNLTVNRTGPGSVTLGTSLTVTGALTLTEGTVITGANTLIAGAAATVTRTNGFVAGNLRKSVATGSPSLAFEIGSGTTYAPVALAFSGVTVAGTVTASTAAGEHPNVATSGIDATRSVNRRWTLANSGTTFGTYAAMLSFPAGEVDAGVDPAQLTVWRYAAPNWSMATTGATTPTSTEGTGLTGFGDLAVGEQREYTITSSAGPNGSITPAGAVTVLHGASETFFFGPNSGYEVDDVLVDGGSVGTPASHTFSNVTANHTIHVNFALSEYVLTVNTVGNGAVNRAPDQATYPHGTNVVLTAVPDFGYQFAGWAGDVTGSQNPVGVIMNAPKSVTATFTRIPVGYERAPYVGPYTAITTGGGASTLLVAADDSTRSIPLPFPFVYSGIPYTTANFLAVNANGFAYFTRAAVTASSSALASNAALYTTSTPNGTLAPWYDDLSVGVVGTNPAGRVLYQTQGSPGSRKLFVQWTDVSSAGSTSGGQPRRINFQLVLSEGTQEIEFRYGAVTGTSHSALESASMGLEDSLGAVFLDATTGSKLTSNGLRTTNKWPGGHMRFVPQVPGAVPGGTYTVGPGGTYNALSEAVADINHKGIAGPVTLSLTSAVADSSNGNVFPILLGPVDGNSPENTITIKPASGVTTLTYRGNESGNAGNQALATAIGATNEPILGVIGADYVTIENLALVGGAQVDRGLLVLPTSRTDGATNNDFRNLTITLNRTNASSIGVQQAIPVGPTNADGTNSFNRYRGIAIANAYAGISLAGNAAFFDTGCEIGNASIGTDGVAHDIGNGSVQTFGIRALNQADIHIHGSVVRSVTGTSTSAVDGILLENQGAFTVSSGICRIVGNSIYSLTNTSASAGKVSGIRALLSANAASESRIYNNFIWNLNSNSTSASQRRIVGINLQETGLGAGARHQVDFNTVRLAPFNLLTSNACLEIGTTTGPQMRIRNNVFANFTGAQSGATKHYCWVTPTAGSIGPAGSVSDHNVLHVNNAVNGFVGLAGGADHGTLASWQGVAGSDANSFSGNPQLVSPDNLHINPSLPTPVESNGSTFAGAIPWATDDIDGNARAATPDIGADEGSFLSPSAHDVAAVSVNLPVPGSLVIAGATFAPQASFENQGASNESSVPVRFRIRGPQPATTIVYDQAVSVPTLPAGATQIVTFPSTSIAADGFYTLEAIAELAGDVTPANDLTSAAFEVSGPLSGDYPVGAGRSAPFHTITHAVARLNTVGVDGAVRFLLEDASYGPAETFPIVFGTPSGVSASNTVTLKPAPGTVVTISGSSATTMLEINGSDHVTIDGSNSVGATRDLTIQNTNASASSAVIWAHSNTTDGATQNTVKNVRLVGSTGTLVGVGFGGSAIGLTSNGTNLAGNRIENVAVERTQVGIYVAGASGAGKSTGTVVTRNQLDAASPNQLTRAGIIARFQDGIQITENVVGNLSSSALVDVIGISLGLLTVTSDIFTGDEVVNATVSRNAVRGVASSHPNGQTAAGIAIARTTSGTTMVVNNMVSGVISNAQDPNLTVGLYSGGGSTTRFWFNSVWMSGNRGTAPAPSLALGLGDSVATFDVRNNVLVNTQTATGGSDSYVIGTVAGVSFANLTSNFNDLYSTSGLFAVRGGLANADDADILTLTEWRTVTGKDASSISADPLFLGTNDLHVDIKAPSASPVANVGQAIAGVTTDFDGEPGNRTTTPDIGADEFATYNLNLTLVGSGTVAKNPDRLNYESGATVQLTATPAVGWSFAGWSGSASGTTNPIDVLMNGHKNITATFTQNQYALTVNTVGNGSVARVPNQATYTHGTVVQLTATPSPGWRFVAWSGAATGTTNPVNVTMDAAKTVTATFELETYTLTVNPVGSGTVAKDPDQPEYLAGATVELTATPAVGWHFVGWSGDATGATNPLTVTMDGDKTITATFAINTYPLTVNTVGSGTVAKTPDQAAYDHGTVVQLTATPAVGWTFTGWSGDASGTANPLDVTMDAAKTVTATFTINTYTLTVTPDANGAVDRDPDQALYDHGTEVTLTAVPNAGFHFVEWGGDATGTTSPLVVTMDDHRSITATFGFHLDVAVTGSGTVARVPDRENFAPGAVVQLTATPAPGWHFTGWNGDASGTANPLDVTMDANKSITATFAINTYSLTVNTVGDGAVAKAPDQALYDHGTVVQLTATPAVGWSFAGWSGDASGTANPLDVTLDAAKTITATFTLNTYALTVNTVGSGTVAKVPDQPAYDHGTLVELTATPAPGWTFTGWSGDASGTTNPLNVTMDAAKTITATFTINTYALTVNTVGDGAVAKAPDQPLYDHGTVVQLTATPAVGWSFAGWSGDAGGIVNPLDVTMDGPKTITATFTINTYALSVNTVGDGAVAKVPDQPLYDHGTVVQLTATPAPNWHFVGWSGDASGTTNPLDVTMDGAKSITATFAIDTYALTVNTVGDGAVAKVPDQPLYDHGTVVQLTATPASGWTFTGWSGDASGTTNPLDVTMDAAKTITATFTINTYALTVNTVGDGAVAKVPDQALYDHGTVVQLTATPAIGWTFTGWSGDASGTTNPLDVTMDAAKTITATFTLNTYTLTVNAGPNGTVTKDPDQATYDHGTVVELTAVPEAGYHLVGWGGDASGTTNPLSVTMDGAKTITATFAINTYPLAVTVLGPGSVTRNPDLPEYPHGTVVELTAVESGGPGTHFVEWYGNACCNGVGATTVNVVMTEPQSITAVFTVDETEPPVAQVVYPNGAETFVEGQTVTIQWSATDNEAVVAVDLLLSRDGPTGPFTPIATAISNFPSSHQWVVTLPATGQAYLRVVARDANGNTGADDSDQAFTIIPPSVDVGAALPRQFALAAVYPNPARGKADIGYDVPHEANVRIALVDVQGREIALLANGRHSAGRHSVRWTGADGRGRVVPGLYFIRMDAPTGRFTRRLIVAP